jgi:catechol 2,3-dioxygenase-like lactoylglutathione lyase family enzyme
MSRVQLALNVADLTEAIDFYSKLFDTPPAKIRPGYANFAIAEPPLKLVLIEHADAAETLNHLGIEVDHRDDVHAAQLRLARNELATTVENEVSCCYALQDKVWVEDPDGNSWEVFVVKGEASVAKEQTSKGGCCVPKVQDVAATKASGGCCG